VLRRGRVVPGELVQMREDRIVASPHIQQPHDVLAGRRKAHVFERGVEAELVEFADRWSRSGRSRPSRKRSAAGTARAWSADRGCLVEQVVEPEVEGGRAVKLDVGVLGKIAARVFAQCVPDGPEYQRRGCYRARGLRRFVITRPVAPRSLSATEFTHVEVILHPAYIKAARPTAARPCRSPCRNTASTTLRSTKLHVRVVHELAIPSFRRPEIPGLQLQLVDRSGNSPRPPTATVFVGVGRILLPIRGRRSGRGCRRSR